MYEMAVGFVAVPILITGYAYGAYPLLLRLLAFLGKRDESRPSPSDEWPLISVSLPAYNEADEIRGALEALLAADYPVERCQIVVVSDASTDGTDQIVREYEDRGVELVRLESRGGKTAAENAALPHLQGEIVVNTDASVRVHAGALKELVRQVRRPGVGVASGRDVSVGGEGVEGEANAGEAGYVGYEMWVRSLESQLGGIVGASGCLYAIRRDLHDWRVPEHLSRDFAAALTAREHGYRSVSVAEAICEVPRTGSLVHEFRRKVRTITRGLQTLIFKRHLLNPFRWGLFAWKLWSHKVARWLGAALAPVAVAGMLLWSLESSIALVGVALLFLSAVGAALAFRDPSGEDTPDIARLCGYLYAANAAAALACWRVLRDRKDAVWEPTRR